jgi:transposase
MLAEVRERGVEVSYYGVWHFVTRAGFTAKKACTPANGIAPTQRTGASAGSVTSVGSTPSVWSSSTQPG